MAQAVGAGPGAGAEPRAGPGAGKAGFFFVRVNSCDFVDQLVPRKAIHEITRTNTKERFNNPNV